MSAPPTTIELLEHVVRLEQQQVPVDVLAARILAPLLEALDARAGALLCYRRDEAVLALAAGRGLSAPGAERLTPLRWGGSGAWEMPLRALVDRKAYVLDGPEAQAFATELVGDGGASVAVIPLHRWLQPVGVILAIGDSPPDPERILGYRLAYDTLAIALAAALWSPGQRTTSADADAPPPTLVCEAWLDLRVRAQVEATRLFVESRTGGGLGDDRAAIDSMLHELHGAVEALRAERRLEEAERATLADRLAAAERDRADHAARTAALERELGRHETLLSEARTELSRAQVAVPGAQAVTSTGAPREAASAASIAQAPPAVAAPRPAAPSDTRPRRALPVRRPPPHRPSTVRRRPRRRVCSTPTPSRRDDIVAALARAIPSPPARGLVVVNLFDASAETLAEVAAAAKGGATVVGYATDGTRSRVLGAVRCFADPPVPGEAAVAFESQPRGGRRVISLSDDIDAFIPAKAELTKLGYSVSMACDDKQAIDLLALLNPDAVLVDLRAAPESAAAFVDALAPETGRILTVLVYGDVARGSLRRAVDRLLRPMRLDPNDLARVCRGVLASVPASAGARPAGVSPIRPAERAAATPRRTAGGRA